MVRNVKLRRMGGSVGSITKIEPALAAFEIPFMFENVDAFLRSDAHQLATSGALAA